MLRLHVPETSAHVSTRVTRRVPCYKEAVVRLASILVTAFLALSASGVGDLVFPELCPPGESSTTEDPGGCPATCVRCNCCAQPTDLFAAAPAAYRVVRVDYAPIAAPNLLLPESREILHVPKAFQG